MQAAPGEEPEPLCRRIGQRKRERVCDREKARGFLLAELVWGGRSLSSRRGTGGGGGC